MSCTFHIFPNFLNNSVARGRLPLTGAWSRRCLGFLLPPVSAPLLVCIMPPIGNSILIIIDVMFTTISSGSEVERRHIRVGPALPWLVGTLASSLLSALGLLATVASLRGYWQVST